MTDENLLTRSWSNSWKHSGFRIQLSASVGLLAIVIVFLPHFFFFIQQRNGWQLRDPLLNLLPVKDVSLITFTLIYSAVVVAIVRFASYPILLLRTVQSYCLLLIMRMLCILLVPLNEPQQLIMLNDPFVTAIGYGGKPITRDLFFSGHTATIALLFFWAPERWLKLFLFIVAVAVASCVLIQHVHYTVDVIAAPVFSWICYKVFLNKKYLQHWSE